jgi:hypothetical protein
VLKVLTGEAMGAANSTTKFGFRIRTRTGMRVDNLMIHGRDLDDARRKLEQMYRHCQVLESRAVVPPGRTEDHHASFEDVVSLVTK